MLRLEPIDLVSKQRFKNKAVFYREKEKKKFSRNKSKKEKELNGTRLCLSKSMKERGSKIGMLKESYKRTCLI
jgi:hypothetical protein